MPQHDTGRLGQRIRRWRRQGIQRGLPKTQQNLDIVGCAPGPASASAPQPPALYAAIQPLDFRPAPPPQRTHARGTLSLSRGPIRAPKANMRLTILNLHDPLAFLPRSHAALLARSPHARVQRTPASCRSCALPWAWTTARASTRCTEGRDRAATEGRDRALTKGRDGAGTEGRDGAGTEGRDGAVRDVTEQRQRDVTEHRQRDVTEQRPRDVTEQGPRDVTEQRQRDKGSDRAATKGSQGAATEGRDGAAGQWFACVMPLFCPLQMDIMDMILTVPHLFAAADAGVFVLEADLRGWAEWQHTQMVV